MSPVDGQAALDLREPEVTPAVVHRQPTMSAALRLAIQVAGLEHKQLYLDLDIDKAQWSRIVSGQAHFPQDKLCRFCAVVDNDVVLEWFAHARGFRLVRLESELESENRLLRERLRELEHEREVELRLLKDLRP